MQNYTDSLGEELRRWVRPSSESHWLGSH